jgi:hypothetical protein
MRAGGELTKKPKDLTAAEQKYYTWILEALTWVGVGGEADLETIKTVSRIGARCDSLRKIVAGLDSPLVPKGQNGSQLHPAYESLASLETRYRDCLSSLYLSPKARGQCRLPADQQAGLAKHDEELNPILKLLGS